MGFTRGFYKKVEVGKLSGIVTVRWLSSDSFLFLLDKEDPLKFIRSNGDVYTPDALFTDLGSVPRPLWIFKNYSPMGYVPAYIVHDWLFESKRCDMGITSDMNVKESALNMSEIINALMEKEEMVESSSTTLQAMYLAVGSPIAENYWTAGKCRLPAEAYLKKNGFMADVLMEFSIDFSE